MYLTCRASGFCFGVVKRGLKKVVDIKGILLGRFSCGSNMYFDLS